MNKAKLKLIRLQLDKIDDELLNFIKKRTDLVKKIIKIKKFKKQIIDKKRIKIVLRRIKKNSIKKGIDPILTRKIWLSIIYSYVDFQKRNFKK